MIKATRWSAMLVALALTACSGTNGGSNAPAGAMLPNTGTLPNGSTVQSSESTNSSSLSAIGPNTAAMAHVSVTEFPVNDTLNGSIAIGTSGTAEFIFANGNKGIERLSPENRFTTIPIANPIPAGFTPIVPAGFNDQPVMGGIGSGPDNLIVAGGELGPFENPNDCCEMFVDVPVTGSVARRVSNDQLFELDSQTLIRFTGFVNTNNTLWMSTTSSQPLQQQVEQTGCLVAAEGTDFSDLKFNCSSTHLQSLGFFAAIALGTDNMLWVANDGQTQDPLNIVRPSILVVNPTNPAAAVQIHQFMLPTMSHITAMVTNRSDHAVWFADQGLNEIGRISETGQIKFFHIPTPNAGLAGITTDPNFPTVLWFTERTANKVGRITTDGITFHEPVPTANAKLGNMVTTSGAIFFTEAHAIAKIAR